jgi:hypothetical protein
MSLAMVKSASAFSILEDICYQQTMLKSAGFISNAVGMVGKASGVLKAGFRQGGSAASREIFAPGRKITINADKSISNIYNPSSGFVGNAMAKQKPMSDRAMSFMANSVDRMQGAADKVHDAVGGKLSAIRSAAKDQFSAFGAKVKNVRDQAAAKISGHFNSQPDISPASLARSRTKVNPATTRYIGRSKLPASNAPTTYNKSSQVIDLASTKNTGTAGGLGYSSGDFTKPGVGVSHSEANRARQQGFRDSVDLTKRQNRPMNPGELDARNNPRAAKVQIQRATRYTDRQRAA